MLRGNRNGRVRRIEGDLIGFGGEMRKGKKEMREVREYELNGIVGSGGVEDQDGATFSPRA